MRVAEVVDCSIRGKRDQIVGAYISRRSKDVEVINTELATSVVSEQQASELMPL